MGAKKFLKPTKTHILVFVLLLIIGLFVILLNFGAGQYVYSFPFYFYIINLPLGIIFFSAPELALLAWILLPIYWYILASIITYIINVLRSKGTSKNNQNAVV